MRKATRLDREIAECLAKRSGTSKGRVKRRQHHSTKQSSPRQEEILMVANDAALEGDAKRALKVLSQGKQRKITTTFNRTTPESAEAGDFSETGWIDEEGDPIEIAADDIQDAVDDEDEQPVTEAIARAAVKWLRRNYASEFSSDRHFDLNGWYSTSWETIDYTTGTDEERSFHLENFTEAEEQLIHSYMFRRSR